MALTERQKAILKLILENNETITINQIANKMGTSVRVVRYNLKLLDIWLYEKKYRIKKGKSSSISIEIEKTKREELLNELADLPQPMIVLSEEQRRNKIILKLFTTDKPVLIKQIALELGVSRTTIIKDFEIVRTWLQRNNLDLESRPNRGSELVGNEFQIREGEISFILETSKEIILLLLQGKSPYEHVHKIEKAWGKGNSPITFLNSWDLPFCFSMVKNLEQLLGIRYADIDRLSLTLYLTILIERGKQKKFVTLPDKVLFKNNNEQIWKYSSEIIHKISKRIGISIPEIEVDFLIQEIIGAKIETKTEQTGNGNFQFFSDEIQETATEIITSTALQLNPELINDTRLVKNLSAHLVPVIHRLQYGLHIRNPLVQDIKIQYPYIFKVAKKSCATLEEKLRTTIPDEEIGFITLYLVAAMERQRISTPKKVRIVSICAEGIATAWFIMSRLNAEFSTVEVVRAMSVTEYSEEGLPDNVDLLITTIPLNIKEEVPVMVINPIPTKGDLEAIREVVGKFTAHIEPLTSISPEDGPHLSTLLTADMIRTQVQVESWEEMVDQVGNLLLVKKYVEPEFIQAMKDNIHRFGPYVVTVPGVALFHANHSKGAKELSMSLITLKEPVEFDTGDKGPVDIAIALAALNDRSHLRSLSELVSLLKDDILLNKIRTSTTAQDVAKILEEIKE